MGKERFARGRKRRSTRGPVEWEQRRRRTL